MFGQSPAHRDQRARTLLGTAFRPCGDTVCFHLRKIHFGSEDTVTEVCHNAAGREGPDRSGKKITVTVQKLLCQPRTIILQHACMRSFCIAGSVAAVQTGTKVAFMQTDHLTLDPHPCQLFKSDLYINLTVSAAPSCSKCNNFFPHRIPPFYGLFLMVLGIIHYSRIIND